MGLPAGYTCRYVHPRMCTAASAVATCYHQLVFTSMWLFAKWVRRCAQAVVGQRVCWRTSRGMHPRAPSCAAPRADARQQVSQVPGTPRPGAPGAGASRAHPAQHDGCGTRRSDARMRAGRCRVHIWNLLAYSLHWFPSHSRWLDGGHVLGGAAHRKAEKEQHRAH